MASRVTERSAPDASRETEDTPRRYKPKETRALILSAAKELFRTQGYSQTSSLEVARMAQVAEGSLFYHFGSKANLLAAVGEDYATAKVDAMRAGESDLSKLEPGILIARAFAFVRDNGMVMDRTGLPMGSPDLQPFINANRTVVVAFITRCMMASQSAVCADKDEETTAVRASLSYAVVLDAMHHVRQAKEAEQAHRIMCVTIQFVREACGFGHVTDIPDILTERPHVSTTKDAF